MTTNDIALNVEMRNISITEIENEPRARDLDIGKRLGFNRPRAIRQLIERNIAEFEGFGRLATRRGESRGQEFTEYWLTEEQSLLAATLSSAPNAPAVRAMLIRAFVAWRRGHLGGTANLPPEVLEMIRRDDGISRMLAHKVTEMGKQVSALISLVQPNAPGVVVTDGLTAGEVCDLSRVTAKYPRGIAARVSKRMTQFCAVRKIEVPVTRLGRVRAQVFPTHAAREWLDLEGRGLIKRWLEEKKGQTVLRLVPSVAAE